jgi:hypothetical protein
MLIPSFSLAALYSVLFSSYLTVQGQVASRAAKFDTDHTCGAGALGITGRYASKTDSFGIDGVWKMDPSTAMHVSYGVTEEKILGLGMETGFDVWGRQNVVDLAYSPPQDTAAVKVTMRQGKTKVCGYYSFSNFSSEKFKNHKSRYELDAKLNDFESLKMTFDQGTRAAKVKVARRLDPRNSIQAEYNYVTSTKKFVALTLKHAYNKMHTISLGANYGTRKFKLDWDVKTQNGPWNLSTTFGFNTAPLKGDFTIKRRFEL